MFQKKKLYKIKFRKLGCIPSSTMLVDAIDEVRAVCDDYIAEIYSIEEYELGRG